MKTQLLVIFLIIISLKLFADGVEPEGSGTEAEPYQIATLENLLWISTSYGINNDHFIQIADIDATETEDWNNGAGFRPILTDSGAFSGSYDGQDYTISNLFINRPDVSQQGMFSTLSNASIENLNLINIAVSGHGEVGALAGVISDNTTIINCLIEDALIIGYNYTGGIVGISYDDSIIWNCFISGFVGAEFRYVGGLVGKHEDSLINTCITAMDSILGYKYVGGLVGESLGTSVIINSTSLVSYLEGESYVGGFVGSQEVGSSISSSYSEGAVFGLGGVGGFAGFNKGSIINCFSTTDVEVVSGHGGGFIGSSHVLGNISNCYSTGLVSSDSTPNYIGGFSGSESGNYENNFWDTDTSGLINGISSYPWQVSGVTGKTTEEMQSVATFTDTTLTGLDFPWDFVSNPYYDIENDDIWDINPDMNNGYPHITEPTVGIEDDTIAFSDKTAQLLGNYPNPFNPTTTINFSLVQDSDVELIIFNIKGQKINQLVKERMSAGNHSIIWNGKDVNGKPISSGIYLYQLISDNYSKINKMILLK